MTAQEKLKNKNKENKFICVGLDTDINKLPEHLKSSSRAIINFNRSIIEAVYPFAAAFKVNLAFYEKEGIEGLKNLEETLALIPDDVLTIADGKRGDIGNTSEMYAAALFDKLRFDASTLNPLMGEDSLLPFLKYSDKLHFILALTSNPGAAEFQKAVLKDGNYLYQSIIKKVKDWNKNSNCGIVFGATKLEELENNLKLINSLPLLIPGVGAQGGSVKELISVLNKRFSGNFLINVSRTILYKSSDKDFAVKAKEELINFNNLIASLR